MSDGPHIRFGTQAFTYPRWRGVFYPPGTPSNRFLYEYARRLDFVELDVTYYRIPSPELVDRWIAATPPGCLFGAKAPKVVTQERKLVGVDAEIDAFLAAMRAFGDRLGPILFQMSPNFRFPEDFGALRRALDRCPRDLEILFEFRHPGWFRAEVAATLKDAGVGWTLNDLPNLPRAIDGPAFGPVTAPFVWVRLIGNHDAPVTDDRLVFDRGAELDAWGTWIGRLPGDVRRVYVTAGNSYEGHSPATLHRLAERLGRRLPAPPTGPPPRPDQPRLFDL